jgi:hypothetical protein
LGLKIANLQQWLTRNRMLLWWLIFIPLLSLILICNTSLLKIPPRVLNDSLLSFQYKIFSTASLIVLARVALVATGLVVILICLFFPLFRVGKEGVQWTKELEEELARASGEITGEEIENLIKDESFRWSLIHGWIKLKEPEPQDAHLLLRELMATIWEAFPDYKLSICFVKGKNSWGITHSLLPRLILGEAMIALDDERTYGLQLPFANDEYLLLRIYTNYPEGFSQIDEKFILALGEVFLQKAIKSGVEPERLLAHYDRIPLSLNTGEVYDDRG